LKLLPALVSAVEEKGYLHPTPIQAQAIPAVLDGKDVLGGARTGTGKTAAFTLPILQRLSLVKKNSKAIRALILAPTRELAAQIEESVVAYGKNLKLTSTLLIGGVNQNPQVRALNAGIDILVACPGRLLDLHGQGHVDLSGVETLVLDEADRMLDMGFFREINKLLALMPPKKQALLFSATFPEEILSLARSLLHNPVSIQVTPANTTVQLITQSKYMVGRDKKDGLLEQLIKENNWSQVLVFTRYKQGANKVSEMLNSKGITAMALHGNKSQSARTEALKSFKDGTLRALVATDIAARGIDIEDLPHVVNYEIPNEPEDYVHRIGRTGRAGKPGFAISLFCVDEEGFMAGIERFTKQSIPQVPCPEAFLPAIGEKGEPIAFGRQVIWGGAGPKPSGDVMNAALHKAKKQASIARQNNPQGRFQQQKRKEQQQNGGQQTSRGGGQSQSQPRQQQNGGQQQQQPRQQGNGQGGRGGRGRGRGGFGGRGGGGRGGGGGGRGGYGGGSDGGFPAPKRQKLE
jgi:ATP-dependent RNA helicase RhlE